MDPPHGTANVNVAFSNVPPGVKTGHDVHGSLFKNVTMTRSVQLTHASRDQPKSPDPNHVGSFA
jgi:hypothetical protein